MGGSGLRFFSDANSKRFTLKPGTSPSDDMRMRNSVHAVADSHQSRVIHGNPEFLTAFLLLGAALGTAALAPWLFSLAEHASSLHPMLDTSPLAVLGACVVALAIHEAGFAAAAGVAGLRVEGYRFAGTGGFVLSITPALPDSARGKLFIALSGGPAACFGAGCFFLTLFLVAILEGPVSGAGFFGLEAVALFSMCLLSVIPLEYNGTRNAGFVLKSLVSGSRTGRQISASFACLASAAVGRRPEHWPQQVSEVIAVPHDDAAGFLMGRYLGYLRCLDTGDIGGAHRQLAPMVKLYEGVSREFLGGYACEIAYFQARHRGRPDSAWRWLAQVDNLPRVPAVVMARARAAGYLAEGDHEKAKPELDRIVHEIQASPMNGFMLFEMSLLDDLRSHYGLEPRSCTIAHSRENPESETAPRLKLVSIGRR